MGFHFHSQNFDNFKVFISTITGNHRQSLMLKNDSGLETNLRLNAIAFAFYYLFLKYSMKFSLECSFMCALISAQDQKIISSL